LQSEGDFQVKADIPGVPKEAIKVNVDNNVLTVSVQQESKTEDEKEEEVHPSCSTLTCYSSL
jgi:HSP20 family molecular chaperone IbpA